MSAPEGLFAVEPLRKHLRANPNVVKHPDGMNDGVIIRGSIELTRADHEFRLTPTEGQVGGATFATVPAHTTKIPSPLTPPPIWTESPSRAIAAPVGPTSSMLPTKPRDE